MINWDKWHTKEKVKKIPKNYFLMDLLRKYLPKKGNCIELGCSPGRFLIALSKNFDYSLTGLDISSIDNTDENLLRNNITGVKLIKTNFLEYTPVKKYDIVCSFGLIEHFKNPEKLFHHFDKFCKKNGSMVIGIPNFRYFFRIIHFFFGKRIYHNYKIMNLKKIKKITKGYKTIYLNYYPKLFNFNFYIKSRFTSPYIIYIGKKI